MASLTDLAKRAADNRRADDPAAAQEDVRDPDAPLPRMPTEEPDEPEPPEPEPREVRVVELVRVLEHRPDAWGAAAYNIGTTPAHIAADDPRRLRLTLWNRDDTEAVMVGPDPAGLESGAGVELVAGGDPVVFTHTAAVYAICVGGDDGNAPVHVASEYRTTSER